MVLVKEESVPSVTWPTVQATQALNWRTSVTANAVLTLIHCTTQGQLLPPKHDSNEFCLHFSEEIISDFFFFKHTSPSNLCPGRTHSIGSQLQHLENGSGYIRNITALST
jgi:hypothetical protein